MRITRRQEMTVSEMLSLGKELEELERPAAAARVGGRPKKNAEPTETSGQFPAVFTGRTIDKLGEALGISETEHWEYR